MDRAEEFNVDDVVVGCNMEITTQCNGMRATIFEPLQYVCVRNPDGRIYTDYFYRARWADGMIAWVRPRNLRKPPEEFDAATRQEATALFARLTSKFPFEQELHTMLVKRRVQA